MGPGFFKEKDHTEASSSPEIKEVLGISLGALRERLEALENSHPAAIELLVAPVLGVIGGTNPNMRVLQERHPLIAETLTLLLTCHPYAAHQEWAVHKIGELPSWLAGSVLTTAIAAGLRSDALVAGVSTLATTLGGSAAEELLLSLRQNNSSLNDGLIKFARSFSQPLSSLDSWHTIGEYPLTAEPLAASGTESRKEFFHSVPDAHDELSVLARHPFKSADEQHAQALAAFTQLKPFASQSLQPSEFSRDYLDTIWRTFSDNLPMKAFAATFAAFQRDESTRRLVLDQVSELDEALAKSVKPLVDQELRSSPIHLSDEEYLQWCAEQSGTPRVRSEGDR